MPRHWHSAPHRQWLSGRLLDDVEATAQLAVAGVPVCCCNLLENSGQHLAPALTCKAGVPAVRGLRWLPLRLGGHGPNVGVDEA